MVINTLGATWNLPEGSFTRRRARFSRQRNFARSALTRPADWFDRMPRWDESFSSIKID